MSTEVTLPELGESVTEATVSRWLKEVGDHVDADEPLLEVSTDKVDTEIPSPVAGTLLEIKFNEDDTASTGAVSSSLNLISSRVPATRDVISVATCSVLTSSRGSSSSTWSPTSFTYTEL
ncbi:hypothetical protein FAM22019_001139, partial [Propionibacterium freudenreichii]|nr:hypothetical protein [Propionibacterium freudenreichii]